MISLRLMCILYLIAMCYNFVSNFFASKKKHAYEKWKSSYNVSLFKVIIAEKSDLISCIVIVIFFSNEKQIKRSLCSHANFRAIRIENFSRYRYKHASPQYVRATSVHSDHWRMFLFDAF